MLKITLKGLIKKISLSIMIFFSFYGRTQIELTELSPMPKRISNNAVCMAEVEGENFLYSFAGIDSTKFFSGISLSSFRYSTNLDSWEQIASLPDTLGKIAASASVVKNKIFIFGGYHVFANGNEISSNKVHVFDPKLNSFLPDAAPIPVPIDDQVQVVWRDSLIFVITGWSNSASVANVQVFNPFFNTWEVGSSVPNTSVYKAFGANGVVIGDTIYYIGGAAGGNNFPAQKTLRKGVVNPLLPTEIAWSAPVVLENFYRGVVTSDNVSKLYFLGGSSVSYTKTYYKMVQRTFYNLV